MYALRQCMKLGQASLRRFSTNSSKGMASNQLKAEDTWRFKRLKAKQELYQNSPVEEVYLKGGMFDIIMYRFILGGTLVGLGGDFYYMYLLANVLP